MGFSINTNAGAMVALQSLSSTNAGMSQVQSRINAGLKVASTKDDSATYAIAQSLRADIGGLNAVRSSLDRAKSTLDVAVSAAESITDVLVQMKEKATAASDQGLDDDSRTALKADFDKLSAQLASYINSAEFNGSNILRSDGAGINAMINADDSSQLITVGNLGLDAAGGTLEDFVDTATGTPAKSSGKTATWTTATGASDSAEASAKSVDDAITAMKTHLSDLGSASRQIDAQLEFSSKLSDTIETGIGNLVDADLAKESARLQALQTKQQLGLQALSIANQAPQSILGLFR